MIDEILQYNQQFVAAKGYEKYITSKYPDKHLAVLSCMDTRLTELLPAALGLKNGDAKFIKNAGGLVISPFDSAMRSLIVAIFELGVNEIMVVAHSECGACHMHYDAFHAHMKARGIADSTLETIRRSGINLNEWLEGFLSRGNKTLLMVTHDRYFLDRVCNLIVELDNNTIYTYQGNYAYYLEKRQARLDNARAEVQHANNLYRRELDWMRRQPQARGHKAKYREDAFYELEAKAKQRIEERQVRLKSNNVYIGSKIFECQYVSKAWSPEKVILHDFYYNFARFEKMGIVGNNGTGKSTFIKMLLGEVQPDGGRFDIGETVRFGYFSQEGLKFDEQKKVIDIVTDIAEYVDLGGGRHLSASQFLQHFMFSPEEQYNYVYKLSGGEKRKLYLCTVLMRNPNFLVLDEPTNDLDIKTLQVLEEYLQDFPGCVIIVSHDRYFMDKVVDHLLVFKGEGEVQDFPGNYTQYRQWSQLSLQTEVKAAPAEKKEKPAYRNETKRKLSYKEKTEFEQLGKDIAALEAEQAEIEAQLSSGALSVDEITEKSKRLPILKDELDEKSMRWLELSEI